MPRNPFAGGAFDPGGFADPTDDGGSGGGGGGGGGGDEEESDGRDPFAGGAFDPGGFADPTDDGGGDDSGSSPSGSVGPSRQGRDDRTDGDAGASVTSPAPAPDPSPGRSTGPSRQGRDDRTDGDAGASVTVPADPTPDPAPSPDTGSSSSGPQFGPGPNTDGGLGDPDPGGDGGEVVDDAAEFVDSAEATDEIVERATTGGLLSERGESAGLFPATVGDGGGAAIGDGRVDISETRLRETAEASLETGQSLDIGAVTSAQAAAISPFLGGQGVNPSGQELDPLGDPDPGTENPAEEFVEGAASLPFDFPGAAAEAETAAEAGQSLVVDDLVEDFGAGEVAETATAQGRDRAEQTAAAARQNPAGFAGGISAGLLAGGAGVAAGGGAASGLRAGLRAEVDPRIGPFGTTAETRAARGFRDFLADDRGQLQLRPESRDRDGGDSGTATDDELGPDLDPFDRSDTRLFDPNRQFGDVGGMADDGPTVDPSDASSRQDIGGGIGGQGSPGFAPGVDADSFSSRGFGDVSGTELDPNPTSTFADSFSAGGAGAGGLFGVPESEPATGADAGGLLGAPGGFDSTGATADLGDRTRTVTTPFYDGDVFDSTGTTPDLGDRTRTVTTPFYDGDVFDDPTDAGPDSDQPTDSPTDLFDTPTFDRPTDTPTDTPTDIPTDPPTDRPTDFPFFGDEQRDDDMALFGTVSESDTFGSGLQSGSEAFADLYGDGDDSDPFSL